MQIRRALDMRNRADAIRREGEEQVRLILESTGEGLVGLDPAGRCVFSNSASRRMLGRAGPDDDSGFAGMMGKSLLELVGEGSAATRIAESLTSGEAEHAEVATFRRADGSFLPVEFWTHPIVRGGERIGAVLTFVDVSSRQRAEETMRLRDRALRSIAQGIFITDPRRATEPLFYVNAAFERMTGYTLAEATGRDIRFLAGDGTDRATIDRIAEAYRDGKECSVELQLYRKDGAPFWASVSISPVEDTTGKVAHFVGVMTDVTDRKRAEAATEERTRLATLAAEVGVALNGEGGLAEMLQACCELLVRHLDGAFAGSGRSTTATTRSSFAPARACIPTSTGPTGGSRSASSRSAESPRTGSRTSRTTRSTTPRSGTASGPSARGWSRSRATR